MDVVLAASGDGFSLTELGAGLDPAARQQLSEDELADAVRVTEEKAHPRWVWDDTQNWYPKLLAQGIHIQRCVDLRMCHAVLRRAQATAGSPIALAPEGAWDLGDPIHLAGLVRPGEPTLLDLARPTEFLGEEVLAEHARQQEAIEDALEPSRLRLLLAIESAASLVAAELNQEGLPWSARIHDQQLTRLLGPRPRLGGRPGKLEALAAQIRQDLNAPQLNPDSAPELLRALRGVGIEVGTTRQWELERIDHPAIPPLLEYKKLARLLTANGWAWMDAWVQDGRLRTEYVPAGVVTGRWATSGGGALQLPKLIRPAAIADDGWKFVVGDAAQLEPRVLAAMSRDLGLAAAAKGSDLYQGLVDAGIVDTRPRAKVAMLAALYGATSGEAGQLMPRLVRAYPLATGLVEEAARQGELGQQVTTWLGRTSPKPGESWQVVQRRASEPQASPADEQLARRQARDWGRFTRNFVVQGTAAEWASSWLAILRNRLFELDDDHRPALVFFLHDEVIVHTPAALANEVAEAIRAAAKQAGELLFGTFPIDFIMTLDVVDNYADAK